MKVLHSICIIFEEDKLHLGIKNERVHFILFSVYIILVALMNTIIVEGGKDMGNRIYPIGIQNFEKIRKEGYVYVDKTALMYKLVKRGSYYFLSRPRRYGNSLLIATLAAYLAAIRDFFDGVAVDTLY